MMLSDQITKTHTRETLSTTTGSQRRETHSIPTLSLLPRNPIRVEQMMLSDQRIRTHTREILSTTTGSQRRETLNTHTLLLLKRRRMVKTARKMSSETTV